MGFGREGPAGWSAGDGICVDGSCVEEDVSLGRGISVGVTEGLYGLKVLAMPRYL